MNRNTEPASVVDCIERATFEAAVVAGDQELSALHDLPIANKRSRPPEALVIRLDNHLGDAMGSGITGDLRIKPNRPTVNPGGIGVSGANASKLKLTNKAISVTGKGYNHQADYTHLEVNSNV